MMRLQKRILSILIAVLSGLQVHAQDLPNFEFHTGLLFNPSHYNNTPLNAGLDASFFYSIDRSFLAGIDFGAYYPGAIVNVKAEELGAGIFWNGGGTELTEHMLKSWAGITFMYRLVPLSPVNISIFAQASLFYTDRYLEETTLLSPEFYSWYDANYAARTSFCLGGGLVADFQVSRKATLRLTFADRDLSANFFEGFDDQFLSEIYHADKQATIITRNGTSMNAREVSLGVVVKIGQRKL